MNAAHLAERVGGPVDDDGTMLLPSALTSPTMNGKIQRGADAPWGDIFIEGRDTRNGTARWGPALPPRGIDVDGCHHDGLVTVPDGLGYGDITVTLHPVGPEHDTSGWFDGYVLVCVTYPDGFQVVFTSGNYISTLINSTTERSWHEYTRNKANGLARAFLADPSLPMRAVYGGAYSLNGVTDPDIVTGVQMACRALRQVAEDPVAFWATSGVTLLDPLPHPTQTMLELVLAGITTYRSGQDLLHSGVHLSDVLAACCAGFDTTDINDLEWVQQTAIRDWAIAHADQWVNIHALKQEGWSLRAMKIMHPDGLINILGDKHYETLDRSRGSDDSLWRDRYKVDCLLDLVGSARTVSLCVEAGFTITEIEGMVEEGSLPNEETLTEFIALRG